MTVEPISTLGRAGEGWLRGGPVLTGAAAIIAVVVALAVPVVAPEHIVTAATVVLFHCYLAQCWNLAAGYAGQFSLGHVVFLGVGGYTSTVLFTKYGVSPWIGAPIGAVLAAVLGVALSALAFRFRVKGVFFAVMTLSAAEVTRALLENWDFVGSTSGIVMVLADDPPNMLFLSRTAYYVIILAMVAALALATWLLQRSRFGQRLLALREDEDAAEATGIPTFRCKVMVIGISAACTALAGTFYAQLLLFIVPETLLSFEHTLTMMLGVMIGGAGTILGPIVGASAFGLLSEVFRSLPIANSQEATSLLKIVYAVILMVVVVRLPGGIVSLLVARRSR